MKQQHKIKQSGMTLIEILIVLVLIAVVMGIVAANFGERGEQAKVKAAQIDIQNIVNTLDLFKLEVGRYPTQSEGLQALISAPSGLSRWNGPYWKQNKLPVDPWGNDYRYVQPGKNGMPYEIISLGADGVEGGEGVNKDISSGQL
ncbi:MAG: type II secretion system major pseudopilin GspG [Burkholderiales bacterium]|jgi:general secretion pathway protein G|nr:type II secretion system major pseudopilin GspG [Burkholderiales bacterium]